MRTIDRPRLQSLMDREQKKFVADRPKSAALFERARKSLLGGVPMNWMAKWAGAFPPFVREARGAEFFDVDGHRYIDFCLGDTGAMTGHSPSATVSAVEQQARRGITLMLPSEDAIVVGEELQKRFGLPYWQFALTATDANRFSIRLARHITQRPQILVFNWCYHGTVDESFITLQDGVAGARRGNVGPPVDPTVTTSVVEFNDLEALEQALQKEDIACVLAEPALTNVGIVLPKPGYHAALRDITRNHGTLLIIDETHTICAGPGGYTRAESLEPDFLVFGKPIAGGVPGAAYGFTAEVAQCILDRRQNLEDCDTGGIGGTLAGNALSLAAMKATLQRVLTQEAFDRMIPMAERWNDGVAKAIADFELPWNVTRLGCRAEYLFAAQTPRNGTEAHDAMDFELERFMHLYAMNRGILLTPFHNMALMSPVTSKEDIDQHTKVFREAAKELVG